MHDDHKQENNYIGVQGEFDAYACTFDHKGEPVNLGVFVTAKSAAVMHDLYILLVSPKDDRAKSRITLAIKKSLNFPDLFLIKTPDSKKYTRYFSKLNKSEILEAMQEIRKTNMVSISDSIGDDGYIGSIAEETFGDTRKNKGASELDQFLRELEPDNGAAGRSASPRSETTDGSVGPKKRRLDKT